MSTVHGKRERGRPRREWEEHRRKLTDKKKGTCSRRLGWRRTGKPLDLADTNRRLKGQQGIGNRRKEEEEK